MTEKKEHPNAMLLRWIAENEEIQYYHCKKLTWENVSAGAVLKSIVNMPYVVASTKYRIKPKTIRIGKYDVAEPMKEKPAKDSEYHTLNQINGAVCSYTWGDDNTDRQFLSRGMAWLNKEDAELAAKAIKELLTGQ